MTETLNYDPNEMIILIVDDVKPNLKLLTYILEHEGYQTSFAISGKDALERLKSVIPNLILLDLMMPEMNGLEVCEIIKSQPIYANIPIIFLTASQDDAHLVKAFELGAVDYVTKPFKQPELLARIQTQLKITQQAKDLQQKTLELQELNQELDVYNEMVCHDIKNPLGAIRNIASILNYKHASSLDEKVNNSLKDIIILSDRISAIVDKMRDFSRVKQHKIYIDQVDLSFIGKEILEELQENTTKEINIILEPNMLVKGDEVLLRMALTNLLSNAYKFTLKKEQENPEIKFGIVKNKPSEWVEKYQISESELVYFIRDNGVGFDMKNAEKIFQFFTRLYSKDEIEGTGIGLGLVKKIINAHGGKIWCYAEPNHGATFYFTLKEK
jgi:two-component system sensor histidine kinase/response regulator